MGLLEALNAVLQGESPGPASVSDMSEEELRLVERVGRLVNGREDLKNELGIYKEGMESALDHYQLTIRNLSVIKRISELSMQGRDLQSVCNKALNIFATELGLENCSLFFPDHTGTRLEFKAGIIKKRIREGYLEHGNCSFTMGEGAVGAAAMERRPVLIQDAEKDPRFIRKSMHVMVGSLLCIPMISGTELIGVINLSHTRKNFFNLGHKNIFALFANALAEIIAYASLNEEMQGINAALERRVMERTRDIEAYQSTLEGILVSSKDMMFVTDRNGNIIFANPRAFDLGYPKEEITGRPFTYFMAEGQDRNSICGAFSGEGRDDFEAILLDRYGCRREIIMNTAPLNDKGTTRGYLVTARDVTEKKRLEKKLLRAERLAAIGELAAGVAHEINNKLVPVLAYSEMLHTPGKNDKEGRMLARITASALEAKKVVQSLLKFSRQEMMEKKSCDVNGLVSDTLDVYGWKLKSEGIQLDAGLAKGLPVVMADPHQLQQVFINIINNAREAMGGTGGRLKVRTALSQDGFVVVEFTDAGPGIPAELRERIFDPFFTTKDVGEGTGLGLSICYGIVSEHGGDISVASEPGSTTFTIRVPAAVDVLSSCGTGTPAETKACHVGEYGALSGKRVLVIDDEESQLEIIKAILGERCRVTTASSGEEGIQVMEGAEIDLVLTDIRMPGIGGMGVFAWITDNRPKLRDRVVFITGDTCEAGLLKYIEDNNVPTVAKPYNISSLVGTLEDLVACGPQRLAS